MTVQELEELLAAVPHGGVFTMTDTALGIEAVRQLFDMCLPESTLTVTDAVSAPSELRISGNITVGNAVDAPVVVQYTCDESRTTVTGIDIQILEPGWTIETTFFTANLEFVEAFGLQSLYLLLTAVPDVQGVTAPVVGIGVTYRFEGSAGPQELWLSGPVDLEDTTADSSLTGALADVTFSNLKDLEQIVPGLDYSMPDQVPVANELLLTGLRLIVNASSSTIVVAGIDVESRLGWPIIPGLFEFLTLAFSFNVSLPTVSATLSATIMAELLVGGSITVATGITVPGLSLSAETQDELPLSPFLSMFLPGVEMPELTIDHFSAELEAADSLSYYVTINIASDWELVPSVVLRELFLTIQGIDTSTATGSIQATFDVGGVQLYLGAAYIDDASGWMFSGSTVGDSGVDVGAFIRGILEDFGIALPAPIADVVMSQIVLECTTGSSDGENCTFHFECAGTTTLCGMDAVFTPVIDLAYEPKSATWTGVFSGTLVLTSASEEEEEELVFNVTFSTDVESQTIQATYSAAEGGLQFSDIATAIGFGSLPEIPSSLDLTLTSAGFSYNFTTTEFLLGAGTVYGNAVMVSLPPEVGAKSRQYYFLAAVNETFSLTDLPLVGDQLATVANIEVSDMMVAIDSDIATPAIAAEVNSLILAVFPTGYPTLPAEGLPGLFLLHAVIAFGTDPMPVDITMGEESSTTQSNALTATSQATSSSSVTSTTASDGATWFTVQKSFGPVFVERIGTLYESETQIIWFLMDTTVVCGTLTLQLIGLGVGLPLSSFYPKFSVDGIAVTLAEGPTEFSGALVGSFDPVDLYGQFSVVLGRYSIGAIAGYADYHGQPSFFLYGVLNAMLGGPPYFFVTGLSVGFGLNRTLVVPDVSGVYDFPLVQWAVGNAPSCNPSGDVSTQVTSTMNSLTASGVIAPKIGESWFAAGIHFTSFEMVDSFALAVFPLSGDFEIDLLGLSTFAVPPTAPVAEAQLALKATIQPSTGLVAITGQLTPNSYALSKKAKLTGGFAYYMWVSGPYAGQFVITQGGYSPNYAVPDYYPKVPRLGLDWKVDSCLSITGTMYFALTASAVMAGGSLSAVWKSGDIRAWFSVEADFLMVFTPFRYYMSGSVDVGASVRIDLGFTKMTVSAHLGVGFELWGPEFSGKIVVNMSIASFTIAFGGGTKGGDTSVTWPKFVDELLPSESAPTMLNAPRGARRQSLMARKRKRVAAGEPAPAPQVVQIVGLKGVLQILSDQDGELNWLVDGQTFQAQVLNSIPLKECKLNGKSIEPPDGQETNTEFGCGPVNIANDEFQSSLEVTATASGGFVATMVLGAAPTALWQVRKFSSKGVPVGVDPVSDTTIPGVLTGLTVIPTTPVPDQTQLPIPMEYLLYTIEAPIQPVAWSSPTVQTSDPFAPADTVATTIATSPATANRPVILAALLRANLDVYQTTDVSTLQSAESNYLLDQPVLCYLGEPKGN